MTEASNSLTPRTAEAQLNEAAAVSDLCEGKAALVRPLLQWVGDNIVTLRDRNLLDNLEKPALLLLGECRIKLKRTKRDQAFSILSILFSSF